MGQMDGKHLKKSNKSEDERMTDDHVLMTAAETFGAGVETTSTTLLWILAYLLHHPEVKALTLQHKVWYMLVLQWCLQISFTMCARCVFPVTLQVQMRIQKELDEQVGRDRPVSMSDRSRLPYLDCVINEGMRIRPVSPVLIPHTARTNSRFNYLFTQKAVKGWIYKMYLTNFPNRHSVDEKIAVLLYLCWPTLSSFSLSWLEKGKKETWACQSGLCQLTISKCLLGFINKTITLQMLNLSSSIGGHSVQPGTRVLVNMWSIHHDPKHWDKPDLFNPGTTPPTTCRNRTESIWSAPRQTATSFHTSTDRFLDHQGQRVTPSCFLPFGAGPRVCVGESLARLELFLFLSSLLQRMCFRLPKGAPLPSLQGRLGVVLQPLPFSVVVLPRGSTDKALWSEWKTEAEISLYNYKLSNLAWHSNNRRCTLWLTNSFFQN